MALTDRDRGQLILVGGVALALVFIALGVLLNSAAFTGAEASRAGASDADDALSVRDDAVEGIGGALFYANYYDYQSAETARTTLLRDIGTWDSAVGSSGAGHRTLASARLVNVTNGTQIYQDQGQEFTPADNTTDTWNLTTETTDTRRFALAVGADSLHDSRDSTNTFRIEFGTQSNTVESTLYVYDAGNNGTVHLDWSHAGDAGSCSTDQADAVVELTAGTADNCPSLPAFAGPAEPYFVRYVNPGAVEGKYTLVVDNESVSDTPYNPQLEAPPHRVPALYNATVEVTYRTATLDYVSNATVAPEKAPTGTSFGVAPLPPPTLTYAYTDGELATVLPEGEPVRYDTSGDGVNVVGPTRFDLDGDDSEESPYVDGTGELRLIDEANATNSLQSNVGDLGISVGEFRGSPPSVFYVDNDDKQLYRVRPGESPVNVSAPPIESEGDSIAGIGDVDNDGENELAFLGTSNEARYIDDDGTLAAFGSGINNEFTSFGNARSVGSPDDFDGDGVDRMPFVDGSGNVALLAADGTKTALTTSGDADKTGVASADVDDDFLPEVVYVDTGGYLAYVNGDGTGDRITDANGDPIAVDDDVGVA